MKSTKPGRHGIRRDRSCQNAQVDPRNYNGFASNFGTIDKDRGEQKHLLSNKVGTLVY